ncbi:ABC transporter permease [candidate division KSB1 bacterium]|nr:ABC transporter permease [candidate division KSB1 bacterium]RQW03904.1 MAG: ABC transporter permease [candidate division KSB1 bacterium]
MYYNYLKSALRSLWKNRFYSGINIIGLAIGIAAVILILLYVQYESSFDRFHKNGKDIYRLDVTWQWERREAASSTRFLAPVGPTIKAEYPEVKEFTRLRGPFMDYFYLNAKPVKIGNILHADSSFFNMLTFDLLTGESQSALTDPFTIVLSQKTANRFFSTEDVIGKTLQTGNGDIYTITAVAQDPPINSSIQFDMLISFSTLYKQPYMHMGWNGGNQYITYLQLYPDSHADQLEAKLPAMISKYLGENSSIKFIIHLQPFDKLHLFYDPGFLFKQILIFGSIAALILIVAGINFINLSLAQSMKRAKEIGVRKVVGAEKTSLMTQFLTESVLSSLLATAIAVLLVELAYPFFRQLIGQDVPGLDPGQISHLGGLLVIALFIGFAAGSPPAFYLASMLPVKILKNSLFSGHRKNGFRNALIVFQFSVSILLIFATIVIFRQQTFMKNKALGFNKDNILVINLPTEDLRAKNEVIKTSVLELPGIQNATLCSDIPHRGVSANGYRPEGFDTWKVMWIIYGDADFLNTFDLQVTKGRNFDPTRPTDKDAYLVNEKLIESLEWENPLGKTIERSGLHPIIGIVRDFHFAPLNNIIEPLIISMQPERGGFQLLALRLTADDMAGTIRHIQDKIADIVPSAPFEYWFLDDAFDALYRFEEHVNLLFLYFSGLAIFIALLGLYSLVTITTEYKTKQIGIRKVLGSSVFGVTRSISKEFLLPVLLANIIAWPIAYYAASRWLQTFAYRVGISWWIFAGAGALAVVVALITISSQAIKAATANPVEALRYE